jgi:subtilisin-like proprotein convertase family protein
VIRFLLLLSLAIAFLVGDARSAEAQAEWIRRLDDNGNGYVEPDEISDRARPYIERFARQSGLSLSRANSVRRLEYAARRYYERSRDDDDNVQPDPGNSIRGFTPEPGSTLVPGFGLPELKYPYTLEDVEEAESTFRRSDRNDDGFIDRQEADQARWTETNPFNFDANGDGKLSQMELIQRYAKRRIDQRRTELLETVNQSNWQDDYRRDDDDDRDDRDRDYRRYRTMSRTSRELAYSVMERYDFNKNRILDPAEIVSAGMDPGKADFNRDGQVDFDEFNEWLFNEMESQGNEMSEALPTWFFERDANNDRQIQMAEFTDQWDAEKAAEFASYDANKDGIVTTDELLSSRNIVGGQFANQKAKILLPRDAVLSEIDVQEDYMIGDLNVQISITHTHTDHLDCYLTGPDGSEIELFTAVGGSDDHFDRTIFDDEADTNIAKSRPPFRGNFQPEALIKRKPGLSQFKGKNLKGIWQLVIRSSRSDRSGILHGWSLMVKPAEKEEVYYDSPAVSE